MSNSKSAFIFSIRNTFFYAAVVVILSACTSPTAIKKVPQSPPQSIQLYEDTVKELEQNKTEIHNKKTMFFKRIYK